MTLLISHGRPCQAAASSIYRAWVYIDSNRLRISYRTTAVKARIGGSVIRDGEVSYYGVYIRYERWGGGWTVLNG